MENFINLFSSPHHSLTIYKNASYLLELGQLSEKSYNLFYNTYNFHEYYAVATAISNNSNSTPAPAQPPPALNFEHYCDVCTLVKFLISILTVPLLLVLGLAGNIFTIIILATNRSMYAKSINRLLLGLTVSDMILASGVVLIFLLPNVFNFLEAEHLLGWSAAGVPFIYPLLLTSHTASVYFTIAVTIERYFAVAAPIHAKIWFTPRKADWVCVGIVTFAVLYNLPRWWEFSLVTLLRDDDGEVLGALPLTTEFRRSPLFDKLYSKAGFFVLMFMAPILVLLVLNFRIYRIVTLARKSRQELTISQQSENSLTWMLVIVVTVYLGCNSFSIVEAVLKVATGESISALLEVIRNFLVVFHSSINFLIYCAYADSFRALFFELLPNWLARLISCKRKGGLRLQQCASNNSSVKTIVTIV